MLNYRHEARILQQGKELPTKKVYRATSMFSYFSKKHGKHASDASDTPGKSSDESTSRTKPFNESTSRAKPCTDIISMKRTSNLDMIMLYKYAAIESDGYLIKRIGDNISYNIFVRDFSGKVIHDITKRECGIKCLKCKVQWKKRSSKITEMLQRCTKKCYGTPVSITANIVKTGY